MVKQAIERSLRVLVKQNLFALLGGYFVPLSAVTVFSFVCQEIEEPDLILFIHC